MIFSVLLPHQSLNIHLKVHSLSVEGPSNLIDKIPHEARMTYKTMYRISIFK